MKGLILVITILAMFVFGYFVMKKVDELIEENQRLIVLESRDNNCQIRIAAETPMLLDSAATALEVCSDANPYIEFFFSSGKVNRLLQKLLDETVDLALLTEDHVKDLCDDLAFVKILCESGQATETAFGFSIKNPDKENWFYVVWNKNVKSKNRDRVIFALENERNSV